MTAPRVRRLNMGDSIVGLDRLLDASVLPALADPGVSFEGLTIGIARMDRSAPHGGEMHPDGDEFLYLIDGRARVVVETEPLEKVEIVPGDALIVPRGIWHRVEILEPSEIFYATPGSNNQFRPID